MFDPNTQNSLKVNTDGTAGPYLPASASLQEQLEGLLSVNSINYSVSDGGNDDVIFNFENGAEVEWIQKVLDNEP